MVVEDKEISISGRWLKTARLNAEFHECISDPEPFIGALKALYPQAHMFTFLQEIPEDKPVYDYYHEMQSLSLVPLTTYENWWKNKINVKTRNMVRKAGKKNVDIRVVDFDDDLVRGIMGIYNETPVRQGKVFIHYGKDFETTKANHVTFIERSDFIGAYYEDELIGFTKLVHGRNHTSLMQIISMIQHRDKAPTNALIGKAIELCSEKNVPYLHYGLWSRRGLGEFKLHHAFERFEIPRYFVPLTARGRMFLTVRLHHGLADYFPERWLDVLADMRARRNSRRYRNHPSFTGP